MGESDATSPILYGPWTLARLIHKLKPDLIHSMEFQHCGYNVLRARQFFKRGFPPWLATNWGSDIYHFRQDPGHRAQIQRLLRYIDFYSCECHRDIDLAQQLGMTAKVLPVMPNSGGFELSSTARLRAKIPTSRRRVIMLKGYQHFAGRALTALAALERCADIVKDFEVIIFAPSPETVQCAEEMRATTPIRNITVIPFAPHDEMLRMHARARVYLGVSVSDAISTSALEAMAMGAFPIQTNTSCIEEWFNDGEGGFLIPPDNIETIAERIRTALTDDHLVDQAAEINWQVIDTRLNEREMERRVWAFYDEIFSELNGAARV
jgi:glycosyltransferase involved in cell wall biosynthesis